MRSKLFLDKKNLITYRDIACFAIGIIIATSFIFFVLWFKDNYQFQPLIVPRYTSPIPEGSKSVITPPKEISPTPTTTPKSKPRSKADIVGESKYSAFIDHIWFRESGRGTNPAGLAGFCASQGKSNEFGFYPSGKHCFSDFETSVRRLERWYEIDSKGLTYEQKLCYYNSGLKTYSCGYLTMNFEKMN
jgi:hypothetical protein